MKKQSEQNISFIYPELIVFKKNHARLSSDNYSIILATVSHWRDDYDYDEKITKYIVVKQTIFLDPIDDLIYVEENINNEVECLVAITKDKCDFLAHYICSQSTDLVNSGFNTDFYGSINYAGKKKRDHLETILAKKLEESEYWRRILVSAATAEIKENKLKKIAANTKQLKETSNINF